jgi:hypothetical protein
MLTVVRTYFLTVSINKDKLKFCDVFFYRQQIMLEHSSSSESVPSIPERQGPRLYQGSISSRAQVNRVRFRPEPAADRTKKTMSELQSELEENFFHNQSASFKQCVEFVADRVASNLIRIFTRQERLERSQKIKKIGEHS